MWGAENIMIGVITECSFTEPMNVKAHNVLWNTKGM